MQTTLGMSFCVLLLVGAGACSSDKADPPNSGGNGSVLPGSGGSSGANTSGASSAGSTGMPLGGANTGTSGSGGSSGAAQGGLSGAAQDCVNTPLACADKETISGCDPDTLMPISEKCASLISALGPGLTSEGCAVVEGENRSACNYDFQDMKCWEGSNALAVCVKAAGGDEVDPLRVYFSCFSSVDVNLADEGEPDVIVNAKTLIQCMADFITNNTVDCNAAEQECFPAAPGAGGAAP